MNLWKRKKVIVEPPDLSNYVYIMQSDIMKQVFPTGEVRQPRVLSSLSKNKFR